MTRRLQDGELHGLAEVSFEQALDSIFWIEPDGRICRANKAVSRSLGYSREEMLELRVFDFDPDMPAEKWPAHWDQLRREKRVVIDSHHRTKDGRVFPVLISSNFIVFDGREYVCSFVHDVSDRRAREEELQIAMRELAHLKNRLEAENVYLQEELRTEHSFGDVVCGSGRFRETLRRVEQVAPSGATVLIMGETGTGKELLARGVHRLSDRRRRPLVKVNCAALPANLIESELFGHVKGAFTGAIADRTGRFDLADGGTIFLDEIGDLPMELQGKLLRVLQEGEFERVGGMKTRSVDVRVIAATNRDLLKLVETGDFREDLYYRLAVFPILSPPLRERVEDIPSLVAHFIAKYAPRTGKKITKVPRTVMAQLKAYPWPGNVRELENVIERSLIVTRGDALEIEGCLQRGGKGGAVSATLAEVEKRHVLAVLERTGWRIRGVGGAAEVLGLKPTTLESRMKKAGITRPR